MTTFQEYDLVRLKAASDAVPLPVGTEGTVLLVFQADPMAYEVEFFDEEGESLWTYTVQENDLMPLA
jgi:hypothetical protein